jgi:hypothetical protein
MHVSIFSTEMKNNKDIALQIIFYYCATNMSSIDLIKPINVG